MVKHNAQFFVDHHQTVSQRHFRVGADFTIVDVGKAVAFFTDDAPACGAQAGIQTENDHPSFAITSSDTS